MNYSQSNPSWAERALAEFERQQEKRRESQLEGAEQGFLLFREAPYAWDRLKAVLYSETTKFNAVHAGTFICQDPSSEVDTRDFSISSSKDHLALTFYVNEKRIAVNFFARDRQSVRTATYKSEYNFVWVDNEVRALRKGADRYLTLVAFAEELLDLICPAF